MSEPDDVETSLCPVCRQWIDVADDRLIEHEPEDVRIHRRLEDRKCVGSGWWAEP